LNPRASIEQAVQVWSSLVAGEDIESLGWYRAAENFALQVWNSLVEGEVVESLAGLGHLKTLLYKHRTL